MRHPPWLRPGEDDIVTRRPFTACKGLSYARMSEANRRWRVETARFGLTDVDPFIADSVACEFSFSCIRKMNMHPMHSSPIGA